MKRKNGLFGKTAAALLVGLVCSNTFAQELTEKKIL